MLSNTSKYAVRALIYLALHTNEKKIIGIKTISEELNIPSPFLSKILQILAKNKLLVSVKGPNGGFGLAKPADKISLMDIVEIIEGKGFLDDCLIGLTSCTDGITRCPTYIKFNPIRDQIKKLFNSMTIFEFSEDLKKNKKLAL